MHRRFLLLTAETLFCHIAWQQKHTHVIDLTFADALLIVIFTGLISMGGNAITFVHLSVSTVFQTD